MSDTMIFIICGLAILILVCLIILEILFARHRKLVREIEQCEQIMEVLSKNPDITDEELMAMDMPKDLRKEFEKTMRKNNGDV